MVPIRGFCLPKICSWVLLKDMLSKEYSFRSKLWKWNEGKGAWYFMDLPDKESAEIKENYPFAGRGFGSVPVTVTIKDQVWQTSVFPDSKSGKYILPVKKSVREKAGIDEDGVVEFGIKIEF